MNNQHSVADTLRKISITLQQINHFLENEKINQMKMTANKHVFTNNNVHYFENS